MKVVKGTFPVISKGCQASQVALVVKNPLDNAGDMRRGFDPWVRKITWRKVWQLTPVFCLEVTVHGVAKSRE